jgi:hypothetical protein
MRIARLLSPTRGIGIVGSQVVALVALVALTVVPATAEAPADGSAAQRSEQAVTGSEVTSPVVGRSPADTPLGCDGYRAPGSGWTHDRAFGSTGNVFSPCTKCTEAKRRLEASGSFRGYCRDTTSGYRADLYRYCIAC